MLKRERGVKRGKRKEREREKKKRKKEKKDGDNFVLFCYSAEWRLLRTRHSAPKMAYYSIFKRSWRKTVASLIVTRFTDSCLGDT